MALIYTTLVSDTFQRANENPVNPAVWSDYPPTGITANQIVNDELEPGPIAGPAGDSISIYSGITWPVNQWAQVQIDACNSPNFPSTFSSVLLVMGRGAGQTNGYAFEVDGPLGPNCNVSVFSLNNDIPTDYLSDGGNDVQIPLFAGDSIRVELFNGMISAYTIHNGVSTQVLAPITVVPVTLGPAPLNNGPVALDLFMVSDPSDVQLSNFSGGAIIQSGSSGGNRGVQFQYYTQTLPARSVPIAKVSTTPATPSELTDINNTVYAPSSLTATMHDYPFTAFTAADLEVPVAITGDAVYLVPNQFYELTDQTFGSGVPLYYQHPLPIGVTQVTVLDLLGNTVSSSNYVVRTLVRGTATNTYVLHSFPNVNNPNVDFVPYQVRYIDAQGFLHLELLQFQNVISFNPFTASASTYTTTTLTLQVISAGTIYYIRWYAQNGYQLLSPYGTTPNDPWFARVRFNQVPVPPEWATQVWTPQRPFILATWVPGTVLSQNVIQFERRPIYFQNAQYPDVLVYDQNYVLKYALAGKTGNGFLYPWQLNQFVNIDPNTGLVQVSINLDPTDIVFGFYSYQEPDVIFQGLDLNPYTNPAIRNRIVNFYEKSNGEDLLHYIYYQVLNSDGSTFSTNDPSPTTGTNNFFGTVLIGQATSVGDFTFTDIRQRGGGLAPAYQNIPQAVNFWDLGFWDGKPFPAGGAMIIYLPVTVQNEFNTNEVADIVSQIIPMGTIPVIRYYDSAGNETVA